MMEDKLAMNIVNQLFDLAEVPTEKRQAINDKADAFVKRLLADYKTKADKWDALDDKMAEFYKNEDVGGDLVDIGETAARAFGYL